MNPHKIYFGGSRSLACQGQNSILHQVVSAVIESGSVVHVGCQLGADKEVALSVLYRSFLSLVVFAVSPTIKQSPAHVQRCARGGAQIVLAAGGTSAPIPARYLLRSIAAFQGCSHAVFFEPGRGSLAVARECAKANIPVWVFSSTVPAPIPSCAGNWVSSEFFGFSCYGWHNAQLQFFG
jgi:hypothetical protein